MILILPSINKNCVSPPIFFIVTNGAFAVNDLLRKFTLGILLLLRMQKVCSHWFVITSIQNTLEDDSVQYQY